MTDAAEILTAEEEERIEQWLWQTESRTKVELIVVILESIKDYPGTENGSIEAFATALFNTYGIGNRPKNDGVLLLVAVRDRKARIELGAYYGHTRDADAERIMQRAIIPRFKKGDYPGGINAGVRALLREFAGVRIGFPWSLVVIPAAILVSVMVAVSLFRNGKRGWGWVVIGLVIILLLALFRVLAAIARHAGQGSSSGWSSGGLGGFGGGFSGGGGATGSW